MVTLFLNFGVVHPGNDQSLIIKLNAAIKRSDATGTDWHRL